MLAKAICTMSVSATASVFVRTCYWASDLQVLTLTARQCRPRAPHSQLQTHAQHVPLSASLDHEHIPLRRTSLTRASRTLQNHVVACVQHSLCLPSHVGFMMLTFAKKLAYRGHHAVAKTHKSDSSFLTNFSAILSMKGVVFRYWSGVTCQADTGSYRN